MSADNEEHGRITARRRLQLAMLDAAVAKVIRSDQLFCVVLVDGLQGEGGWSLSSNTASPMLVKLLECIIADRTGKPIVEENAEPSPDTAGKLQAQYRKLDAHPTETVRQQLQHALSAVAQAVLKGDPIGEATLLIYLAGCAMVLYRRSVLNFIESRKSKGGTA